MVICLVRGANDLHMVWLIPLPPPSSLASVKSRMVYPSGTGLPRLSWKKAVKRLCVCVFCYCRFCCCYFQYTVALVLYENAAGCWHITESDAAAVSAAEVGSLKPRSHARWSL